VVRRQDFLYLLEEAPQVCRLRFLVFGLRRAGRDIVGESQILLLAPDQDGVRRQGTCLDSFQEVADFVGQRL
jgi:hypothetical protein